VGSVPVLVVASDDRWFRVLEVTLRLGGFDATRCRSIAEAAQQRGPRRSPRAIVLDLAAEAGAVDEVGIERLAAGATVPVVVILSAPRDALRETLAAAGARVLLRPYAPSALYAALTPAGA